MNSRSSEKTSPQLPDNTLTVYNCSEQDCGVRIPGRSWTWQWANGQIPQDSSSLELVFFGYTRCTFIAYTTPVVICKFMSGQFHVFWSIFLLQNKHEIRDARGRQKEKRFVSKEKRKREKEVRGLTETKRNERDDFWRWLSKRDVQSQPSICTGRTAKIIESCCNQVKTKRRKAGAKLGEPVASP